MLASSGLTPGIQIGAHSRVGCNPELAETKSSYSFHLFSKMSILRKNRPIITRRESSRTMSNDRHKDNSQSPASDRSERVYSEQDLWYFKTREGDEVGPFRYRSEAQSNLENFMEQLQAQLK